MKNIAICCVAYNRLKSLCCLLDSLDSALYDRKITLIISVDKSNTTEIEDYANNFIWKHGTKRVIKHEYNLGLRKHILSCGDLLEEFDALVVLEDDITVSPSFYFYTLNCVEKYFDNDEVAGISLYGWSTNPLTLMPFIPLNTGSDVYMMQFAQSWGQVWMKKQWRAFIEWYKSQPKENEYTNNTPRGVRNWSSKSWLKFHIRYCIEENKYFIYPYVPLTTNHSEVGEHNKTPNTVFEVNLLRGIKKEYQLNPDVRYDAFFENEAIYNILGLEASTLCIDLNGLKGNRGNRRYWLSMRRLGYEVIKSYGMVYKPLEINVIENIAGNDIFLYDTSKKIKFRLGIGNIQYVNYLFNYSSLYLHIKNMIKYLINYKQY